MEEAAQPFALATIKREGLDMTEKENRRGVEAKDFVRRAAFPSQDNAVHLARDGNFDRMPIKTADIRAGFQKLGEHTASVRGKMTLRKVSWNVKSDPELIEKRKV